MTTSTDVLNEIASIFEVTVTDIKYTQRDTLFVMYRKLFSYICYDKLSMRMNEISRKLNRPHNYGKLMIHSVKAHIDNCDPIWVSVFNTYKSKSVIWQSLDTSTFNVIPKLKTVICLVSGKEYKSVREASLKMNIKYHTLYGQLTGRNKNKTTLIFK